jgi:hypothetical protein
MARFLDASDLPGDEEIVSAYLQTSIAQPEEESWAIAAFRVLIPNDPERAWRLICMLIDRGPESLLPLIGAWQLEEFVSRHGPEFIADIEREAARSNRFVGALANIWITRGSLPREIETRLVNASRGTIGVLDADDGQV